MFSLEMILQQGQRYVFSDCIDTIIEFADENPPEFADATTLEGIVAHTTREQAVARTRSELIDAINTSYRSEVFIPLLANVKRKCERAGLLTDFLATFGVSLADRSGWLFPQAQAWCLPADVSNELSCE